jgi:hypothetical protein
MSIIKGGTPYAVCEISVDSVLASGVVYPGSIPNFIFLYHRGYNGFGGS